MRASNADGVGKNRDSRPVSGLASITGEVSSTFPMRGKVYHSRC